MPLLGGRLSLTGDLYGNSSLASKQTFFSIATTKQRRSIYLAISCSEEGDINLYWVQERPILLAE